jgi:hypothetical protein
MPFSAAGKMRPRSHVSVQRKACSQFKGFAEVPGGGDHRTRNHVAGIYNGLPLRAINRLRGWAGTSNYDCPSLSESGAFVSGAFGAVYSSR